MSHPYFHSISSSRKFGGKWEDYIQLHSWFDETKSSYPDMRHRTLRHHAEGIFWAEEKFGVVITNSDGKQVPVRAIGEQHVKEDIGWIPTIKTPAQYNEYERQAQVIERHQKWKEQQKQLITEIMEEDAKDGLYDTVNELDKLAEKTFKGDDATTFVQREIWKDGYRKAQETLYTEEQVREAIRIAKSAQNETAFIYEEEEIIQSLKQPKKD